MCEDRVNVFICQVGSAAHFGTFDNFVRACCHAHVHVALGVNEPSNPLVEVDCSYDIPGRGTCGCRRTRGGPCTTGNPLRDEEFPRLDNPWPSVPWRRRTYSLRFAEAGAIPVELHHDCHTGVRSGDGL